MRPSTYLRKRTLRVGLVTAVIAAAAATSIALAQGPAPTVLPVEPDGGIGGEVVLPVEPDGGIGGEVVLPVEPDGGIGD